MSKILDNTTGSPIAIADTGVTVDNVTDYTIPQTDYLLWAASDNIITEIGAGNIVVNDGSGDLSISDGVDLIKGIFPTTINAISDPSSHNDFFYNVAAGIVSGHEAWTKFGRIPDLDVADGKRDVTNFGDINLIATAQTLDVSSDSVNDTSAGTGARTVIISGLDSNWDEISEIVSMNGTTAVTTTNSYLRINRMGVVTAGTDEANDGEITLTDGTNTQALILAGKGSTEQVLFSVPDGKSAYIKMLRASVTNSSGSGQKQAFVEFWVKPFGGAWTQASSEGIDSNGGASVLNAVLPLKINAKSDIKLTATVSQNNSQITGILQFILEAE